ncbi:MAG: ribonuclease P protein component [Clostridia bacterium]
MHKSWKSRKRNRIKRLIRENYRLQKEKLIKATTLFFYGRK